MPYRAVAFLAALAFCPMTAHGQGTLPAVTATAVVYTFQDLSGAEATHEYEQTITDAVSAAFEASGSFRIVPQADWEAGARSSSLTGRDLLSGFDASRLARRLNADLAVSGTYSVIDKDGTERILVTLQCWDAKSSQLAAGFLKASRFDLAFYLSLRDWITGLIPTIHVVTAQPGTASRTDDKPIIQAITFQSADEGMEVLIAGDEAPGVITGGKLLFPVGTIREGTPLRVTKRKAGYHESVQTVKAAQTIMLTPLVKRSSLAALVDWTIGEILGAGAGLRWYPVPDALFASLGAYVFVQPAVASTPRAVIHGDARLAFGGYVFFPPDAPFRLSLETGGGVVLSAFTQPGFPLYTDFYLDVFSVTAEVRLLGIPLFLRIESRYALGIGTNLVGRGWTRDGAPLATVGVLFQW